MNLTYRNMNIDIDDIIHRLKRGGDSFALATVVRTLSVTAAKPGAKAIIDQNGEIIEGWIGGGCARGAVVKAAAQSIADGEPRLVSIHPDEVLKEQRLDVGTDVDGRWVASNMCPSKGSMDIFIEPFLANPELIVVGSSPVALAVRQLASMFSFSLYSINHDNDQATVDIAHRYESWNEVPVEHAHRYIVIATQGAGDLKALSGALAVQSRHIGFVGSQRKMVHLKSKLEERSHDALTRTHIKGPAGLDIGGVTPHEIALSILAELVQIRRSGN